MVIAREHVLDITRASYGHRDVETVRLPLVLALYGDDYRVIYPKPDLSSEKEHWVELVRMGLNPVRMHEHGLSGNAYENHDTKAPFSPHPLHYVCFFGALLKRQEDAHLIYQKHKQVGSLVAQPENIRKTTLVTHQTFYSPLNVLTVSLSDRDPCPPYRPEDFGLEPLRQITPLDRLTFFPWYAYDVLQGSLKHSIAHAPLRSFRLYEHIFSPPPEKSLIRAMAKNYLDRCRTKKDMDTEKYAHYYSLLDHGDLIAEQFREHANILGGVARATLVVSEGATAAEMKQGLRALSHAATSTKKEVLKSMKRAPTLEELKTVRGVGLVEILQFMPYHLLKSLDENALKGILLPFIAKAEDKAALSNCLLDNEERLDTSLPDEQVESYGFSAWTNAFEIEKKRFLYGEELRRVLVEMDAREVALLVLYENYLRHKKEQKHTADVFARLIDSTPRADDVRDLMLSEETQTWVSSFT